MVIIVVALGSYSFALGALQVSTFTFIVQLTLLSSNMSKMHNSLFHIMFFLELPTSLISLNSLTSITGISSLTSLTSPISLTSLMSLTSLITPTSLTSLIILITLTSLITLTLV